MYVYLYIYIYREREREREDLLLVGPASIDENALTFMTLPRVIQLGLGLELR